MASNGNGNGNGNNLMYYAGSRLLSGDYGDKPLFSGNGSGNNPGVRLVDNSDSLSEMLKMVWFPDSELARNVAEALAECDEFLINIEDSKPNREVLQRIEWVKNLCASLCSVNARFADIYKQTAIGVATTAVTERGATLVTMPFGKDWSSKETKSQNNPTGRKF
jgi:hypothetical protein